jgi:DNA polymerase elongation subunit (family B)
MNEREIQSKIKVLENEINILDKEQHAMKILLN